MKKILLISPGVDCEVSTYEGITKLPFVTARAIMAPLHLATIAALTPDDIEVDLWDEPVHGRIDESTEFSKQYDLVGITGSVLHLRRAKQVAQVFRRRGIPVAIGGVGVSVAPEVYRGFFDILFIGEAELIWPEFIAHWRAGNYQPEYRQVTRLDLAISPIPKWDSLAKSMDNYAWGAVQTTRGCPFNCEFCDVIYLHGGRPRQKPIKKVLEEVAALERLGVSTIFFCDDNFIGNPGYTKNLLLELIPLNRSFQYPVTFITQCTVDVAGDEKLLELLADANFSGLFIGIETPNKESLIEIHKPQNYKTNLLADIKKIQSYGIAIRAGMIVGFDNDSTNIFEQQYEFIQEACIPMMSTHILRAPIGTPLWTRLRKEGRIVLDKEHEIYGNLHGANTNIIPRRMTRVELFSGYLWLVEKLSEWRNFEARVRGFVSGVTRKPDISPKKRATKLRFLFGFLKYLLFSMDKETRQTTLRLMRYTRRHAPFMMRRVLGLICMHYSRVVMLKTVRQALRERIDLESSAAFRIEIDRSDIGISEGFKKAYHQFFPDVYRRVYLGLMDQQSTEEVLIEVITNFISRSGKTMESFDDYHRASLSEHIDRIIVKQNDLTRGLSPARTLNDGAIPDINKTGLADEILKAVEQELRDNLVINRERIKG